MDCKEKILPSEKLQKEFEENPLKILEIIRDKKENKDEHIDSSEEEEKVNMNESNSALLNKEKINLDSVMMNDFSNISDSVKNEKHKNKNNINNKIDVNYVNGLNNLNLKPNNNNINYENSLINCNYNSNINFKNKNNNITVNQLNIFFNFNDSQNDKNINDYVNTNNSNNNNFECINNIDLCQNKEVNNIKSTNVFIKEENSKENYNNSDNLNINTINNNSNIKTKNGTNINNKEKDEYKLFLLSNTNVLLENLKTFKGSIISQEFVDNINNEKECLILFKNILPHISTIMCLEYGNYFFQKFLKKLKTEQKLSIYHFIENDFYEIASNKFGTHSIQSLINNIQTPNELIALNKLISKNMYFLFIDNNAYHIMMKIILDFPEDKRKEINSFLIMNIEKLIMNCNGAFCINKFITHNKDLNLRTLLIKNLENNIKELIFNKFCCINLLLILETFGINWGNFIIKEIQRNFGVLCEHPVSKIFVSKVLLFLNNNYAYELKVLLWSLYKNINLMKNLISNKNHTKLLNQMIKYSDEEQKKFLFFLINNNKGKK